MKLMMVRLVRFSRSAFFRDAAETKDAITPKIMPGILFFGAAAAGWSLLEKATPDSFHVGLPVTPYEVGGAALGLLLVLRTNEGINRWWEGRRLWGGIVNQCRNIASSALAYGPDDPVWRRAIVLWTIAFAHASRRSLRNERSMPEVAALMGEDVAARIAEAEHMPSFIAMVLARTLRVGVDRLGMDRYAFLGVDRERLLLIDHIGACERIIKTPLPRAYSIQIRRFIFAFLILLPLGFLTKFGPKYGIYLSPILTMLLSYPLLALDKIGSELQDPFSAHRINHIDLDRITATIEQNLMSLLIGPTYALEIDEIDLAIETPSSP